MAKIVLKRNATVELGTVSHGTMNSRHLIESFESELQRLVSLRSFAHIKKEKKAWRNSGKAWKDVWREEYVNFLFDCLDTVAPEGCYFGATEGDGSDYGFWKIEDCDECW